MFRYIGLLWDPANARASDVANRLSNQFQRLSAEPWKEAIADAGVRLYCLGEHKRGFMVHRLGKNRGAVLGTLFRRNSDPCDATPSAPASFDDTVCSRIAESRGKLLVSEYWGDYVALVQNAAQAFVLMGPATTVPCFTTSIQDVFVFFSCVADWASVEGVRLSVNWNFVAERVLGRLGTAGGSGLKEIAEVHRGECLEVTSESGALRINRRLYWNPVDFSESRALLLDDHDGALNAIRATIVSCIHTLANGHDSVLLRLSGGLDSSIVLGCLKDTPNHPQITGCTFYPLNRRADPRHWARIAARDAGCEVAEWSVDPSELNLEVILSQQLNTEPRWSLHDFSLAPLERAEAAKRQATALFTGDGGDAGLGTLSASFAAHEFVRRRGLHPRMLRAAYDAALCTDESIWRVLRRALRTWGKPLSDDEEMVTGLCKFVTPRAQGMGTAQVLHPWFRDRDVPLHIVRQLGDLPRTPEFYDSFASAEVSAPIRVDPMYAQPVVELLLRIPPYAQIADGRDRGLARRAFEGRVPGPLLNRTWKDRAPQFIGQIVQGNLDLIRQLLLDGLLVREGLLDRAALEQALSSTVDKREFPDGELMWQLDVEVWLRRWHRWRQRKIQVAA